MLFSFRKFCSWIFILAHIFICAGCGYRFVQDGPPGYQRTISVPYVIGDLDGELTSSIIKEISVSGFFRYKNESGNMILLVEIVDSRDDNIGFRYDRKKDNDLKNSIIPDETRMIVSVDVSVVDSASGEVLFAPVRLTADIEFDHYFYSSHEGVNVFSLGQYTDIDAAQDAAQRPLNRRLARKIVDYLAQRLLK